MRKFSGLEIVVSDDVPPDCIDIVQPGKFRWIGGELEIVRRPRLLGRIINAQIPHP